MLEETEQGDYFGYKTDNEDIIYISSTSQAVSELGAERIASALSQDGQEAVSFWIGGAAVEAFLTENEQDRGYAFGHLHQLLKKLELTAS